MSSTMRSLKNRKGTAPVAPPNWLIYNWVAPKFQNLSPPSLAIYNVLKTHSSLTETIFLNDYELIRTTCKLVHANDADDLAKYLLWIFEIPKMSLNLVETLITEEVNSTLNSTTLFRSNSVTSKMLAYYSRSVGKQYLQTTLGPFFKQLKNLGPIEVDPEKIKEDQIASNMQKLRQAAQDLLHGIVYSLDDCPHSLKKICHTINEATNQKFPGHGITAVGGFIFLRFFCPAIVGPDRWGLLKKPPSPAETRTLVLISKCVQNLANGVMFGTKEVFMEPMNDFLQQHTSILNRFLTSISIVPGILKETPISVTSSMLDEAFQKLSELLEKLLDKIALELTQPTVTEKITHSMSDSVAFILRDFPLKDTRALNDFTLLSRFEELLICENFAVLHGLLRAVMSSPKDLDILTRSSVQVLAPKQSTLNFVLRVIEWEVQLTGQQENELKLIEALKVTTRICTAFLQTLGLNYLSKSLGVVISEICQPHGAFEVDETGKNLEAVILAGHQIIGCIVNSLSRCPEVIQHLCSHLYSTLSRKYGNENAIIVLSHIVYVKFFCPAIASPEVFNIIEFVPSKKCTRALELLCLSLKHIANFTYFKESHLQELNLLIKPNYINAKEFLLKMKNPNAKENATEPSIGFEQRGHALLAIRSLMSKDNLARMNKLFEGDSITENVTYKLVNRLATVLADVYRQKLLENNGIR